MKITLMRYFNRMCFRPTPFGICSTVGILNWGTESDIKLEEKITAVIQPGFEHILAEAGKLLEQIPDMEYHPNETLYAVGNEYRYIRTDETGTKRKYVIATARRTTYLDQLLAYGQDGHKLENLALYLSGAFNATLAACKDYLRQLIQAQLLVPALQPNVTGMDYLEQLAMITGKNIHTINRLSLNPSEAVPIPPGPFAESNYVNATRKLSGSISRTFQDRIIDGMHALTLLVPNKTGGHLKEFAHNFSRKFDRQTIPLLRALDPETGVGYGNLGGDYTKSFLIIQEPATWKVPVLPWSEVHSLLLRKMEAAGPGAKEILLSEEDLGTLPPDRDLLETPPTTTVVFRIADTELFLEQAGGATGTALTGRFTTLSNDLDELARTVARDEERRNPEVIFAEIAHFSDSHIANIERRSRLYSHEIPILTGSTSAGENRIPLNDLQVSVQNGKIILSSARLGKRVIPRLSSGYNYTRSDLAVFRFLCDLQHQGLHLKAAFHLENYFPGLDYYPRVTYKNTIIQLATWKIKADDYTHLRNMDDTELKIRKMRKLMFDLSLPRFISINVHDNQLIFDTNNEASLELLSHSLKTGVLAIKEFPFTTHPVVSDQTNRPYISQFIATLSRPDTLYRHVEACNTVQEKQRKFMPLDNWAFFKIYCHHARANEILVQSIYPLMNCLRRRSIIKNWFYIRYTDTGFHIRLRIQADKKYMPRLPSLLSRLLEAPVQEGFVEKMEICSYERELERYPSEVIDLAEASFGLGSESVLQFLAKSRTDESQPEHYLFAFSTIALITDAFGIDFEERSQLFKQLYQSFEKEFSISKDQINSRFRQIRQAGLLNGLQAGDKAYHRSIACQQFYDGCKLLSDATHVYSRERTRQLVADLIHMHLNRFLVYDPRRQELMIYYCLYKGYQSLVAIAGKSGQ